MLFASSRQTWHVSTSLLSATPAAGTCHHCLPIQLCILTSLYATCIRLSVCVTFRATSKLSIISLRLKELLHHRTTHLLCTVTLVTAIGMQVRYVLLAQPADHPVPTPQPDSACLTTGAPPSTRQALAAHLEGCQGPGMGVCKGLTGPEWGYQLAAAAVTLPHMAATLHPLPHHPPPQQHCAQ